LWAKKLFSFLFLIYWRSYSKSVSRAVVSQLNFFTLFLPAARKTDRDGSSVRTVSTSSPTECGSKKAAAFPYISRKTGMSEAITGKPVAIASKPGKPNPSERDGKTRAYEFW